MKLTSNAPDGAQSEILGLILLLSLTLLTVGVILSFGGPAITEGTELSESGQIENEFALLDSKMATSALGASEVQNVEMNLRDGALESQPEGATMRLFHNFSEAQVRATNRTLGKDSFGDGLEELGGNSNWANDLDANMDDIQETLNRTLVEIEMGKVEYLRNDEMIAYEGGGVWKKNVNENQSVMISPPEFHYSLDGQTLTIPLFNVTSEESVASTADTDIRVGTTTEPEQLFDENPIVGGAVKAEVESEYYRAWANFFDTRTQGSVTEENIDAENQTALVELEVPVIEELDGGHSFSGGVSTQRNHDPSDYFGSDPTTGEFFLSASDMIDTTLDEARNDNDNEGTCLEGNNRLDDDDCELTSDGDKLYYVEDGDMSDVEFDIEDGNITLAVDDAPDISSDWQITETASDNSTRVDVMFGADSAQNGEIRGNNALNLDETGNSSDMILFVHSEIDEIEFRGGSADEHAVTLYAPETDLRIRGSPQFDWEGGMVAGSITFQGSGNEGIKEGEDVDIDIGGASDTITYLQVTQNEVNVEAR